jgi:hypothetical protein
MTEPRISLQKVNALVAMVRGSGGRAEVRFICSPDVHPRYVVRIERYNYDTGVATSIFDHNIVIDHPTFTLRDALSVAKERVMNGSEQNAC